MDLVRARTLDTLAERGVGDDAICEMVIRHELQHGETMCQTLAIARLLNDADAAASDEPLPQSPAGEEWVHDSCRRFRDGRARRRLRLRQRAPAP